MLSLLAKSNKTNKIKLSFYLTQIGSLVKLRLMDYRNAQPMIILLLYIKSYKTLATIIKFAASRKHLLNITEIKSNVNTTVILANS